MIMLIPITLWLILLVVLPNKSNGGEYVPDWVRRRSPYLRPVAMTRGERFWFMIQVILVPTVVILGMYWILNTVKP